jgi:hypothetical protein
MEGRTDINLKLCISSMFLKFKNKDYLLCRIVCGKNSRSHSRRKNKVSCDVNSACLQSFHNRTPKNIFCTHSLKIGISRCPRSVETTISHAVFYFAAETRGNCIVKLVFNDVDRRVIVQLILNNTINK